MTGKRHAAVRYRAVSSRVLVAMHEQTFRLTVCHGFESDPILYPDYWMIRSRGLPIRL